MRQDRPRDGLRDPDGPVRSPGARQHLPPGLRDPDDPLPGTVARQVTEMKPVCVPRTICKQVPVEVCVKVPVMVTCPQVVEPSGQSVAASPQGKPL